MATVLHSEEIVYIAMELSKSEWKLAMGTGARVRKVNVRAGDVEGLVRAVEKGKERLGLQADARVRSCYEAGRDGFWIHRVLVARGIENIVVDPASIEVNRKQRRAKTDRLDAEKLLRMLLRYYVYGEKKTWSVVRVPMEAEEDERRLHRESERLVKERGGHSARIRALLALHGINVKGNVARMDPEELRDWKGEKLLPQLVTELRRERKRLELLDEQIAQIKAQYQQRLENPQTVADRVGQKLHQLRCMGPVRSWVLAKEFFGWRDFRNRREVGALAGLTGTPYNSGEQQKDQGISKAGNRRVRTLMVELAWSWLRYQPDSALSQWFWKRFGHGTKRMRRVGIVALARKLLVALWKFVQFDQLPEGALLSTH